MGLVSLLVETLSLLPLSLHAFAVRTDYVSTSPDTSPHQKQLETSSWISNLLNEEEIHFCSSDHPVYGILLEQSEQAKIQPGLELGAPSPQAQ